MYRNKPKSSFTTRKNLIKNELILSSTPVKEAKYTRLQGREFLSILNGKYFFHEVGGNKDLIKIAKTAVQKDNLKALGIELCFETYIDGSGIQRNFLYMSAEDYAKWPYQSNATPDQAIKLNIKTKYRIGNILEGKIIPPSPPIPLTGSGKFPLENRKFSQLADDAYFYTEIEPTKNPVYVAKHIANREDIENLGIILFYETCMDDSGSSRKFIYMSVKDYEKWPFRKHPITSSLAGQIATSQFTTSTTSTSTQQTITSTSASDNLLTMDDQTLQLFSAAMNGLNDVPLSNPESSDLGIDIPLDDQTLQLFSDALNGPNEFPLYNPESSDLGINIPLDDQTLQLFSAAMNGINDVPLSNTESSDLGINVPNHTLPPRIDSTNHPFISSDNFYKPSNSQMWQKPGEVGHLHEEQNEGPAKHRRIT